MRNALRTALAAGVAAGVGLVPVTMNGAAAAPAPYAKTAQVELKTNNPNAGGVIGLQILDFPPSALLLIDLRGSNSGYSEASADSDGSVDRVRLAKVQTDRNGAYAGSVTMPEGWQCEGILRTRDTASDTVVRNRILIGDAENC